VRKRRNWLPVASWQEVRSAARWFFHAYMVFPPDRAAVRAAHRALGAPPQVVTIRDIGSLGAGLDPRDNASTGSLPAASWICAKRRTLAAAGATVKRSECFLQASTMAPQRPLEPAPAPIDPVLSAPSKPPAGVVRMARNKIRPRQKAGWPDEARRKAGSRSRRAASRRTAGDETALAIKHDSLEAVNRHESVEQA